MPRDDAENPALAGASKSDKEKKTLLLRLSPAMWNEVAAWAAEDFRSINGQIEYLLSEALKARRRTGGARPEEKQD